MVKTVHIEAIGMLVLLAGCTSTGPVVEETHDSPACPFGWQIPGPSIHGKVQVGDQGATGAFVRIVHQDSGWSTNLIAGVDSDSPGCFFVYVEPGNLTVEASQDGKHAVRSISVVDNQTTDVVLRLR